MRTTTATELKAGLGQYMESVTREPVAITRNGRKYAVLLAWEDFERFRALEDAWWGEQALKAESQAEYLSNEESLAYLKGKLGGA